MFRIYYGSSDDDDDTVTSSFNDDCCGYDFDNYVPMPSRYTLPPPMPFGYTLPPPRNRAYRQSGHSLTHARVSSQPTTVNKIKRDGSRHFSNHAQGRELLSKLVSQRQTGVFTDVVVQVERREFPCHRAVLAIGTPYFKTMLSSKLAEGSSQLIQLREIDPISFSKVLDFLYTGEISICKDDVQDILQTAHMLLVNKILPHCCKFIQDNLCSSNCLDVMHLADMYGLYALKKSARNMAAKNFLDVAQGEEFLSLSLQELLDLLGDKDLKGANKDDVVQGVTRWLDNAPGESRQTAIQKIFEDTRLSCLRVSMEKLSIGPLSDTPAGVLRGVSEKKKKHESLSVIPFKSAGAEGLTTMTATRKKTTSLYTGTAGTGLLSLRPNRDHSNQEETTSRYTDTTGTRVLRRSLRYSRDHSNQEETTSRYTDTTGTRPLRRWLRYSRDHSNQKETTSLYTGTTGPSLLRRWFRYSRDHSNQEETTFRHTGTTGRFENYARELLAELASQRKTGEFTDVVVQVEGSEFPCHRAVLATTPYFRGTMLSSNLTEGRSNVIQLHGIDSSSFSKILDFLYTGKIFIFKDDVEDILQTAHKLEVNKILQYCCEFMQENLCPSNCVGVMRLADMYGLSDLKKSSRVMTASNFSSVTQDKEFLSLSVQEFLYLIGHEDLKGANEDDVVQGVIRWFDHAPDENRKTAILKILQETPVKVSMVRKLLVALPCESAECLARFTTDREKQLLDTQLELAEKAKSSPDREISEDLAIIVGGWKAARKPHFHDKHPVNIQPKPLQSIICLDPDTQQCYHITDLPMPVSGYMSVASAGGYLYVTGGREQHTIPSRQAFRYEFPTDSWLRLPNMPRGMAEHHSVVVDGKLFVVDSDAKATPLWVMDCYDPDKEAWIKVHLGYPVMQPIKHTLTALGNNKVVLIEVSKLKVPYTYTKVSNMMKMSRSGNDHSLALKSDLVPSQIGMQNLCVHAFDVKRNSMRCADTPVNTSFKNVDIVTTTVNDKLYIRTGYTMSSDLYIFDAEKNTLGLHRDMDVQGNFGLLRAVGDPENSYRYKDRQNGIVDTISHSEFGSYHRERQTPLPFALFGHSFLQTQKSRIGWHCRDLAVVEMQESDCKRTEGSVPESA